MESPQSKFAVGLAEKAPHAERLSIALLMLWTAMSAALLGLDRQLNLWSWGRSDMGALPQVLAFCYAPLFGAAGAATVLAAWRLLTRGPPFPSQPGHWLLVLTGCTAFGVVGARIVLVLVTDEASEQWMLIWGQVGVRVIGNGIGLIVNCLAICYCRGRWRTVFGLALAANVLGLFGAMLWAFTYEYYPYRWRIDTYAYYLVSFALVIAAGLDWFLAKPRRDDLHWIGIVVRVCFTLITLATPYLIQLFQETP